MALIAQRIRVRRQRSEGAYKRLQQLQVELTAAVQRLPVGVLPIAGLSLTLAGALALHAVGPGVAIQRPSGPATSRRLPAGNALPYLPSGIAGAPASVTPAVPNERRLQAVLAADLWQLDNSVVLGSLMGSANLKFPSTSTAAQPAGVPSVAELVRAQERAQSARQALLQSQQRATDAQIAAAQAAVAAAQSQVAAAQIAASSIRPLPPVSTLPAQARTVTAAGPTASPTSTATPTAAASATPGPAAAASAQTELLAAKSELTRTQTALESAQHPYSDAEIEAARNGVAVAQAALARAQSRSNSQPVASSAKKAQIAATLPPAATPAAAAGDVKARAPQGPAGPAPDSAGDDSGDTKADAVAAPAVELAELQHQLDQAQARLALVTAPPDPATVQAALAAEKAAEQRLAALQRLLDSNPVTPAPVSAAVAAAPDAAKRPVQTEATTTPAAAGASGAEEPQPAVRTATAQPSALQQAQDAYNGALQQLEALTGGAPEPLDVKALQADYEAAQRLLDELLARSTPAVLADAAKSPHTQLVIPTTPLNLRPWLWPAHGPITSYFGPSHPLGIDIGQGFGLPIVAAASGVITFSGGDPCCSYGYYVDIDHGNGYMTRYGHMMTPTFLRPGDRVVQGQIIGVSGSTGFSTGPHLHFEIRYNGLPLDPLRLLSQVVTAPLP